MGMARATPPPPACRAATPPVSRMGQPNQATKPVDSAAAPIPTGRPPTPAIGLPKGKGKVPKLRKPGTKKTQKGVTGPVEVPATALEEPAVGTSSCA
eukprot:jgi/Botrbrau1/10967/Bobra.0383s0021.1